MRIPSNIRGADLVVTKSDLDSERNVRYTELTARNGNRRREFHCVYTYNALEILVFSTEHITLRRTTVIASVQDVQLGFSTEAKLECLYACMSKAVSDAVKIIDLFSEIYKSDIRGKLKLSELKPDGNRQIVRLDSY